MLEVTLDAPRTIHDGSQLTVRLTLRNVSEAPMDLYLRGREPTLDVVVTTLDGQPVWRALEGQIIPGILLLVALAPGESLEAKGTCAAGLAPGQYLLRVAMLAETEIAAPEQDLEVRQAP